MNRTRRDVKHTEVRNDAIDAAAPGERKAAFLNKLRLSVAARMFHNHDNTAGTGHQIHGSAHPFHHPARYHPIGEIASFRYLHGTQDRKVDVSAANHRETVGGVEV